MIPKHKTMLIQIENACRNFELCLELYTEADFDAVGIPQTIKGARFLVTKLKKRIKEIR